MTHLKFIVLITCCISLFSYQIIYGQQTPHQLTGLGSVNGYLEYLPSDYNNNTDQYPVLIFLHGSGERGNGSDLDLEKIKTHGPPKLINNGHNMCFNNQGLEECFIVLSPQQGTSQFGWNNDVIPFVDYALANYRIDPDRVYLTGLSMGGDGCWDGMRSNNNIPNRFAAVAPIAGKGMNSEGCTAGERKITIWAFHGNADTATPINGHLQAINGYNSCKETDVLEPIFTEYNGVGHAGSWQNAYRTDNSLHSPNLYEWFLAQNKSQETLNVIDYSAIKESLQPGDEILVFSILGQLIKQSTISYSQNISVFLKTGLSNKKTQLYIIKIIKQNGRHITLKKML